MTAGTRGPDAAQLALVATVVHLVATLAFAGAALLLGVVAAPTFLWTLIAFYWIHLAIVAAAAISALRHGPALERA
jgi:hypothetical protein